MCVRDKEGLYTQWVPGSHCGEVEWAWGKDTNRERG